MDHLESIGRSVQGEIYRRGAFGHRPRVPVLPERLEAVARRRMRPAAWSYVAGSAGQQATERANRAAFGRWAIVPRMLRDISRRDMGVELFGQRLPAPFLLAPIGALEMVHADADLAVAAAARHLGLPMVISTQGSVPMERTAEALGAAPRWFQLYWSSNDELVESFVRRAEAIGCGAIVVTLDTQMLGWRTLDLDLGSLPFVRGQGIAQYTSDPVFTQLVRQRAASPGASARRQRPTPAALRTLVSLARAHPGRFVDNLRSPLPRAAVETFLEVFSRPSLTWSDLAWLRERTKLPILVKGIQDPADALLALEHGVDGMVVSNHGGRQVDGAVGALSMLPEIVDAVAGRVPILFDSGIRGGADAFKALALGAQAVGIGRPWVYGLALDGSRGIEAVMRYLMAELDITMALTGCATLAEIDRAILRSEPR
ncbi:MAG TPA: alpha-hydroxy-acid oxidizing protein [Candidatus Limnocylindria bacterium]|nr:alpha-hydroxy-acid oxidizing protein [Candidatus Limnocylindria bacterium]